MPRLSGLGSGKCSRRGVVSASFLCVVLVLLVFSGVPGLLVVGDGSGESQVFVEAAGVGGSQVFQPTMVKPEGVDRDSNGVVDVLDEEIAQRLVDGTVGRRVAVMVALRSKPTVHDAAFFARFGGRVTTELLTFAVYGFGGEIAYDGILGFAASDSNVLLVEKDQACFAQVAYAARQVGARPYVWHTLGLQGDPESSIAILDTGIDDSHVDFAPGYGNLNFSRKIVGWNDYITETSAPVDDNGHGSHVAGLAAGDGFYSTNASGSALASWGANLGAVGTSGTYLISGMMVNKTGNITVRVKWWNYGSARLSSLKLYYAGKNLTSGWVQVASVDTPIQDSWYVLNYVVNAAPVGGYDMYHVLMSLSSGTGDLFSMFQVSWPYVPPGDGDSVWTGIAPQTRLVGVKVLDSSGSGSSIELLQALNWVVANRQTYHIVVVSMSLGFGIEVNIINSAVVSLVSSGVATVVSAGNSGSGGNLIFTPGSVDEALTVAATNQFDDITSFSSQGGKSGYKGKTTKPDLAAPGGSFFAVPLLSADSNDNEAEGSWSEVYVNDSALMQGTSMSAPVVSGAVSIVAQALGGFSNWSWTRRQALLPKMILLMTATETFPNLREDDTRTYSPSLQRGGKDVHEGFGRLNLGVAVDAVLRSLEVGGTVTGELGKPPSISDISVLGQKLAWARKVELTTVGEYNFTLAVPAGADFDLYLYNATGTWYGEPVIVASSTDEVTGGFEQIVLSAPYNGTYFLVVKRATSVTGGGVFSLEASFRAFHDVAVLGVQPLSVSVYRGSVVNVTVTVRNVGLNAESFDVTTFYNDTVLDVRGFSGLAVGATVVFNCTWDTGGLAVGSYVFRAEADVVPGEYIVVNNVAFGPSDVVVKILGDIDGDRVVGGLDLALFHLAYGSQFGDVSWDADCDLNSDGVVDVVDVFILGDNFGKTAP